MPDKVESTVLEDAGEIVATCPSCGYNRFVIRNYLYDMPLVGRVLLSIGVCEKCGYRSTDVRLAEARSEKRVEYTVKEPRDLNALVVKSARAHVTIPELGLELKPGPAAEGFITTIEGLLHRFKDILDLLCSDRPSEECRRRQKELEDALEGRRVFRVILEDPDGASAIIPGYEPQHPRPAESTRS